MSTFLSSHSITQPLGAACLYCHNLVPDLREIYPRAYDKIVIKYRELLSGSFADCIYCELILQFFQGVYTVLKYYELEATATIRFTERRRAKADHTDRHELVPTDRHELVPVVTGVYLHSGRVTMVHRFGPARPPPFEIYTLQGQ